MSIRNRLILSFVLCLTLFCVSMFFLSRSFLGTISEHRFAEQAHSHLTAVEDKIINFIAPAVSSLRYLAHTDLVRNSAGKLTSYIDTTEKTWLYYKNHPPYEQRVYDEFMTEMRSRDSFDLIFMANIDGQYAQAPEGRFKNPGYDPRKRSWFGELLQSPANVVISEPYRTTGAAVVCSVMYKTYDMDGLFLGMVGMDYRLATLIADIDTRRILETGRVLVLNSKGEALGQEQDDLTGELTLQEGQTLGAKIAAEPDGARFVSLQNGKKKYVVSHSLKTLRWRLAVVFDSAEVTKTRDQFLQMLLICGVAVMLVASVIIVRMAHTVAHPIEQLIDASGIISRGEHETSENARMALQQKLSVKGSGETRLLAKSLRTLVSTLQERIAAAEEASKAKGRFLSNMSHEIRTPLNAVIGMTTIGISAKDIEKKDYAFGKIHDASSHLLGVVNDILDMSKIEANKVELSHTKFSYELMIAKVAHLLAFRVEEKKQTFNITQSNIPPRLIGDSQRLAQVLTNLLSNATKFTPEHGSISLDSTLLSEENDLCTILFTVKDSGIGITAEQQERLFQPFQQADSSTSREFGGTGLGLAISKRIIELMGGEIWMESTLGEGASFCFTVRLARGSESDEPEESVPNRHIPQETVSGTGHSRQKATPRPDAATPPLLSSRETEPSAGLVTPARPNTGVSLPESPLEGHNTPPALAFPGRRILLAEDVAINREICMALLEPLKLTIDCAENGEEAVAMFSNNQSGYSLILMDLQMPKMDGLQATRQIRALGTPEAQTIPIIATTANAFTEDVANCLAAGMDDHVSKPLDSDVVLAKLRAILAS